MSDQANDRGGFRVRRQLPADPARIYAAFVEPAKLEHWFVVDGFRTPADRMRVTAKTGGRLDAVMVAEADGSEIPFGFEYTELDPPSRIALRFEQPAELITVLLQPIGEGATDLAYDFESSPPPKDEAAARRGVEDMLDCIEAGIGMGII